MSYSIGVAEPINILYIEHDNYILCTLKSFFFLTVGKKMNGWKITYVIFFVASGCPSSPLISYNIDIIGSFASMLISILWFCFKLLTLHSFSWLFSSGHFSKILGFCVLLGAEYIAAFTFFHIHLYFWTYLVLDLVVKVL